MCPFLLDCWVNSEDFILHETPPAMLADAGVGKLEQDLCRPLQDVQQVGALVALPDQILPIAEGALGQPWFQDLQQMVLHSA